VTLLPTSADDDAPAAEAASDPSIAPDLPAAASGAGPDVAQFGPLNPVAQTQSPLTQVPPLKHPALLVQSLSLVGVGVGVEVPVIVGVDDADADEEGVGVSVSLDVAV